MVAKIELDTHLSANRDLKHLDPQICGWETFAHDVFDPHSTYNQVLEEETSAAARLAGAGLQTSDAVIQVLSAGLEQARHLRHASWIPGDAAAVWLAGMLLREPARLNWHIRRLDGVSPSSAWAYLAETIGQRSRFTSARQLDCIRLMQAWPETMDWDMRRGTVLEPIARMAFRSLHKNSLVPDDAALDAAHTFHGSPRMPWLIGNPDEILRRRDIAQGARVLIDYKCPGVMPAPAEHAEPEYITQLHLYTEICNQANVRTEVMALARLYVDPGLAHAWVDLLQAGQLTLQAVAANALWLTRSKSGVVSIEHQKIPYDPVFLDQVINACSDADARVQQGRLSPVFVRPKVVLPQILRVQARTIAEQLAGLIVMDKQIETAKQPLMVALQNIYRGIDTQRLDAGVSPLSLGKSCPLDVASAIQFLDSCNVDTRPFIKPQQPKPPRFDTHKLVEALHAVGADPIDFCGEQYRMQLSRSSRPEVVANIEALQERAERLLASVINTAEAAVQGCPEPADGPVEALLETPEM